MTTTRTRQPGAATAVLGLLASFSLVLLATPGLLSVSAQSAGDGKLSSALQSLQEEFADAVHEVTPAVLDLQRQLVEALGTYKTKVEGEESIGQRTLADLIDAAQAYFKELETLKVMEARDQSKSIAGKELLKVRIEVRTEAAAFLKRYSDATEARYSTGEVTQTDVAWARAKALKAEVMLEILKGAAK